MILGLFIRDIGLDSTPGILTQYGTITIISTNTYT